MIRNGKKDLSKMFDYLYYKLYQATLKSSLNAIPHFMAPVYLGGLISVNVLVLNAFLAKMDVFPFLFSSTVTGGVFAILLIIAAMSYYRKDKREHILDKYSQESKNERIKGNVIVAIYVSISFLLIFAVAFFKPGKL
ncbi:hypothetical protein OI18_15195 [Flavihumibacter solisilvae]|uniref:Uncharacterized protein n=2 Tax=Flavihumibacter solisilvae TaxID=1349421 RepID=A0A0C1IIA4_9BACT|nr:hypothetical protein OI18_15195 [Flavihumibacter solisilvae]